MLTFEGRQNCELVEDFYNGGTGSSGSFGFDYGVELLDVSEALIDLDSGGSGNFANEPTPDTVVFFTIGGEIILDVAAGFDVGFSFYYGSAVPVTVTVYDTMGASGLVLGLLLLPAQGSSPAGAESPRLSLFVRTPNIGGAENGAFFPYPSPAPMRVTSSFRKVAQGSAGRVEGGLEGIHVCPGDRLLDLIASDAPAFGGSYMFGTNEAARDVRHACGFDCLEVARRSRVLAVDFNHMGIQVVPHGPLGHRHARPEHPSKPSENFAPARRFVDESLVTTELNQDPGRVFGDHATFEGVEISLIERLIVKRQHIRDLRVCQCFRSCVH